MKLMLLISVLALCSASAENLRTSVSEEDKSKSKSKSNSNSKDKSKSKSKSNSKDKSKSKSKSNSHSKCPSNGKCPINGKVSPWTVWSPCSELCGKGSQTRSRAVIVEPANGGDNPCGTLQDCLEQTQECNTQPCPDSPVCTCPEAVCNCNPTCNCASGCAHGKCDIKLKFKTCERPHFAVSADELEFTVELSNGVSISKTQDLDNQNLGGINEIKFPRACLDETVSKVSVKNLDKDAWCIESMEVIYGAGWTIPFDTTDTHGTVTTCGQLPGWVENQVSGGCSVNAAFDEYGCNNPIHFTPGLTPECPGCGLVVATADPPTEEITPDHWGTLCTPIPETACFVTVTMGTVVDHFRPTSTKSFCDMLETYENHQWWNPTISAWVTPSYSGPNNGLGGSVAGWLSGNTGGTDHRLYVAYWGVSGTIIGTNRLGGCCYSVENNADAAAAAWNQAFTMTWTSPPAGSSCDDLVPTDDACPSP